MSVIRAIISAIIEAFKEKNIIYEKDGALWFKTTDFGDEKDRVVVRKNGQTTYFASDIAYHMDKFKRGFHRVIDVWGADHHGYIPRVTGAIEASGLNRDRFSVILVQLVNLLREKEPVAMSTRAGEFVTLKEVVKEVGRDAARTRGNQPHESYDPLCGSCRRQRNTYGTAQNNILSDGSCNFFSRLLQ
jgi:arginyl-tRNA synthetase